MSSLWVGYDWLLLVYGWELLCGKLFGGVLLIVWGVSGVQCLLCLLVCWCMQFSVSGCSIYCLFCWLLVWLVGCGYCLVCDLI